MSNQNLSAKLLLHGGIYAAARFLERAAGIVLVPLYARVLRNQGYGVVALLGSITPFLTVLLGQGLPGAWFRLRHDYEDGEARRRFETTIVWYLVVSTALVTMLVSLAGDWLAALLSDRLRYFPLVFLAVVTGALRVIADLYVRRANAELRPIAVVAFTLPRTVMMLGAVIVGVAVLDLGPLGKVAAEALVALAAALVALLLLRPASPRVVSKRVLHRSLAFGLPLVPHALATQVNALVGRLLISRFLGLGATGIYSMGAAIADVGNLIAVSMNQGFSPLFIAEARRLDRGQLQGRERSLAKQGLARGGLLMVATIGCVGVGLTAFAREALMVLATDEFRDSYRVVAPLSAATVLRASYFAFSQPLFTHGQAVRRMPIVSFAGAALNIAMNLVLLPRVGFVGGAYALLIANAGTVLLALPMGQAVLRLPHSRLHWLRLYACVGGALAALYALDLSVTDLVWRVVAKTCIAVISALATLRLAGTTPRKLLELLRTRKLPPDGAGS